MREVIKVIERDNRAESGRDVIVSRCSTELRTLFSDVLSLVYDIEPRSRKVYWLCVDCGTSHTEWFSLILFQTDRPVNSCSTRVAVRSVTPRSLDRRSVLISRLMSMSMFQLTERVQWYRLF